MRKPDLTLGLAVAAVILAAAAYLGAAMLGSDDDTVETAPSASQSTVTLNGVVLRQETLVYRENKADYLIPREGDFVSGGEVICVEDADGYFAAQNGGTEYSGKLLRAPMSGYFCTDLDGLEGATPSDYPTLSPQDTDNVLCRIVYGASWYFVAEDSDGVFTEGETVTLHILRDYVATVQSAENGIVVFRVREGLYSVLSLRYETATVTK